MLSFLTVICIKMNGMAVLTDVFCFSVLSGFFKTSPVTTLCNLAVFVLKSVVQGHHVLAVLCCFKNFFKNIVTVRSYFTEEMKLKVMNNLKYFTLIISGNT